MPRIKCDVCGRFRAEGKAHTCAPRFQQQQPGQGEAPGVKPSLGVWLLGLLGIAVMLGGLVALLWGAR